MTVHVDIPPFKCFIRAEFLFDMDGAYVGKFEPCTVYAVSSYKGHYPTFKILLNNGALFDYMPICAFVSSERYNSADNLFLGDLVFGKACPAYEITVSRHALLSGSVRIQAYFPRVKKWIGVVEYICTIDWHTDNHNVQLVFLENGQYALVPNHKILFMKRDSTSEPSLPPYKKLHKEWKPE